MLNSRYKKIWNMLFQDVVPSRARIEKKEATAENGICKFKGTEIEYQCQVY